MEVTLIIDMQTEFSTYKDVEMDCVRLAERSVRRNIPIVLVEYHGFNMTSDTIWRAVRRGKHYIVRKNEMSGGLQIHNLLSQVGLMPSVFHVGGIYLNDCVWATVQDLALNRYGSAQFRIYQEAVTGASPTSSIKEDRWDIDSKRIKWVTTKCPDRLNLHQKAPIYEVPEEWKLPTPELTIMDPDLQIYRVGSWNGCKCDPRFHNEPCPIHEEATC